MNLAVDSKEEFLKQYGSRAYSKLYVFDGSMELVGNIEAFALGKTLDFLKFSDDYAFVTYKRPDKLVIILNMEKPDNPYVVGESNFPAFSDLCVYPVSDQTFFQIRYPHSDNEVYDRNVNIELYDISATEAYQPIKTSFLVYENANCFLKSAAVYIPRR